MIRYIAFNAIICEANYSVEVRDFPFQILKIYLYW